MKEFRVSHKSGKITRVQGQIISKRVMYADIDFGYHERDGEMVITHIESGVAVAAFDLYQSGLYPERVDAVLEAVMDDFGEKAFFDLLDSSNPLPTEH